MDVDTGLLLQMHRKKKYGEVMIAKKVLNLKLRPKQEEIIREFFAKGKEGKPKYEEFLLVCGKKGGKTFLTATINLIIIYKLIIGEDFFKRFNIIPQDVYLLNTCAGKEQSIKVYLNQVKGVLSLSPFLQQFLDRNPTVDEVKFKIPKYDNNLILKAQSSRSTSSLGYLCFSVTFDELAWFQDNSARNCSKEVYAALFPNIKPFRGWGYSFILTSPSDTGSWFCSHYEFAKNSDKKLVIEYSTWEMNPGISRESLDEEFKRDFDKATMDYGGKFIEAIGGAFHPEVIDKAIKLDIRDISIKDKRERVIALDPALKKDAYSLAMGYADDYKLCVDYVTLWQGRRDNPVKISEVEDHIRYLCKTYSITRIVLDQRYSASTIQRLGDEGLPIFETFFNMSYKQLIYQNLKEKLNMGEVFLPHHERVKAEFLALRRKGMGSNIRYEAPTSGPVQTDDMCDAVANCCYQLSQLRIEGSGTGDFALDGEEVLVDEESIKAKLKELSPEAKKRKEEEFKKQRKFEEAEAKKIQDAGGFQIG